ncbi:MAG: hypothetical protein AABY16_04690 [Nanoarchaeota archaeon]
MAELKREYRGEKEVIIYRLIGEDGQKVYGIGRAVNSDSLPNFLARAQIGEYRDMAVIKLITGINEKGITAIKGVFAGRFIRGVTDITPADLEAVLCESNPQSP